MNTNTIAPPDLGKLNELAKLHALSYASPHHFTMSVNGLREIFAALQLPAGNTIALDALRPFAKLLEQAVAAGKQDATNVDCQIAVSDMRRAVAAIAALEQAEEPFGWVSRGDDGSVMLELNGDQRIDDGDAVYRAQPFSALEAEPQPIETAPKDERILLFFPSFGPWAAAWWPGSWSWTREQWAIHTPFSGQGDRAVFATDGPKPTHWTHEPPDPLPATLPATPPKD